MRILFTVEFYSPRIGGAEEVVRQVAEHLAEKGHQVTVATTKLADRADTVMHGVRIAEFAIRGDRVRGIRGSKDEIERYKTFLESDFDVIVNYAAHVWTTDLAFDVLERIRGAKVLVPCGYSRLHDPRYRSYFKNLPNVLRAYDSLVYMSAHYQDKKFGDRNGCNGSAVIIPNGASEREFIPLIPKEKAKKMLGLTTAFVVLTVGNHYRSKGHSFVRDAFKRMKRRDATLLILGHVPEAAFWKRIGHVLLGCYLSCRFSSLLHPRVRMHAWEREKVVLAFQAADVFLFGSTVECAPVVLYESFASQTPFVSRPAGNIGDYADVARIVSTPQEMADRANELLGHDCAATALTKQAYRMWHASYRWDQIARKYEGLFLELSSKKRE